jgi:hypothetical protein
MRNAQHKKRQCGGSLVFDPFNDPAHPNQSSLVKRKYDQNNLAIYKSLSGNITAFFTQKERRTVDLFMNFIFPYIRVKQSYIGKWADIDVETMGAGGFGVTIGGSTYILKIMKWSDSAITEVIRSHGVSDLHGLGRPDAPNPYLNKAYASFFYNPVMVDAKRDIDDRVQPVDQRFLHTSKYIPLPNIRTWAMISKNIDITIDEQAVTTTLTTLANARPNLTIDLGDPLIFHLIEKGVIDMHDYKVSIFQYNFNDLVMSVFIHDTLHGLLTLHQQHLVHGDIKLPNLILVDQTSSPTMIIPNRGQLPATPYVVKIIDFGGIQTTNDKYQCPVGTLTPVYYDGTNFQKNKILSILYDVHCIAAAILELCGQSYAQISQYNQMDFNTVLSYVMALRPHRGTFENEPHYFKALKLIMLANVVEDAFIHHERFNLPNIEDTPLVFTSRLQYVVTICNYLDNITVPASTSQLLPPIQKMDMS